MRIWIPFSPETNEITGEFKVCLGCYHARFRGWSTCPGILLPATTMLTLSPRLRLLIVVEETVNGTVQSLELLLMLIGPAELIDQ